MGLESVKEKSYRLFKMKRRFVFYSIFTLLIIIDSILLSSPNLLGKIGLFIYKYSYLGTFPKTLLTVTIIVFAAIIISEVIHGIVRNGLIKRWMGFFILFLLIVLATGILIKTGFDFSKWTYAHTGQRFKYGAYLLPTMLILIFGYQLFTLPRKVGSELPKDTQ